jgi:hypothetical protein
MNSSPVSFDLKKWSICIIKNDRKTIEAGRPWGHLGTRLCCQCPQITLRKDVWVFLTLPWCWHSPLFLQFMTVCSFGGHILIQALLYSPNQWSFPLFFFFNHGDFSTNKTFSKIFECMWKTKNKKNSVEVGIKENDGRGWIQLWYIVRTFINVTMYPQFNNNKNK